MKTLKKVGLETGQLTDEELRYIDERVVEAVRPALVGRQTLSCLLGFLTLASRRGEATRLLI